ncbi:MAG: SDR family oxidoreductase [Kofleriaceae bacterium]
MRIFITGATGFIGRHLVPELLVGGHHVIGLTRSDTGAELLAELGAKIARGDVNDLPHLRSLVAGADAVIHAAFEHDFSNVTLHSENDRRVIAVLGEVAPRLIVTSGTGLVRAKPGELARETDPHATAAEFPRAATEEAADALIARGHHTIVVRLPQVHDATTFGRISLQIDLARTHGHVAFVGAGTNRIPAAHVLDVARLFRLAIENGHAGARYHAVAEEGVPMHAIAAAIGERLQLPAASITAEAAPTYFGPIAHLAALDLSASGALTRSELAWTPDGPSLLSDLRRLP